MTGDNPNTFSDLELRIFPRGEAGYPVEITLEGQQEFPRGYLPADIVPWAPGGDLAADGQKLFDTLLSDANLRAAWAEARGRAQQRRIRLRIDPTAAELHTLPWELVQEDQAMLSANAATPFSRYLPIALPWGGAVEQRPIRILVAISNPNDLSGQYNLAQLDVAQERQALESILSPNLTSPNLQIDFLDPPVTLEQLEEKLRTGYHILHYVGHGVFNARRGQAALYLQDNNGNTHLVPDDAVIGMLARLQNRPRLIFLAACQSAMRSTVDAFVGLGPKLVSVGVPAVVAMQDFVAVETARQLSEVFYKRLAEHGVVDRALNEARSTLLTAGRPDAAVPVLFMRHKSGQLWSAEANARGQVLGKAPANFWRVLVSKIQAGQCIPIIGPRVHGRWLPMPSEASRLLADQFGYPFTDKENLARVAQYEATLNGRCSPHDQWLELLKQSFNARLPLEWQLPKDKLPGQELAKLVQAAGWDRFTADDPNEVHRVLAAFNLPLYLTTNPDCFMSEALAAQGKKPARELCRWTEDLDDLQLLYEQHEAEPSSEAPLVYHFFGNDTRSDSLVLTEDNALEFVANFSSHQDRRPEHILSKLTNNLLLFVGYSMYDWEFRVLMRCLLSTLPPRPPKFNHVAVQLEETPGADSKKVQDFMEKYFSQSYTNVFWGNTAQFVAELREQWEAAQ